jgi:NAD(P)-dependent dehydrogenase (short-subunit alcohol dehydrogenase family)
MAEPWWPRHHSNPRQVRMNVDLSGQVAFVSGGAENIGGAVSRQLAELGADVAIADIKGPSAEAKAAEIRALGRRALAFEGDCGNWDNMARFTKATVDEWGRIDIAVNLVGEGIRVPSFFDETEEDWDNQLRLNLKSHFYLVRCVEPYMKAQGRGKIVCLSADSGRPGGGLLTRACYAAAKAGVIAFVKAMAKDLGPEGIRVNSVSPGPTTTTKTVAGTTAQHTVTDIVIERTPLGRRAVPDETAAAIVFHCTPASDFITAEVISEKGRLTMAS